jgi:hypothetical protein
MAAVFKVKPVEKMVNMTSKKHGKFVKWELVSSHIGRRSFVSNHFGKIPIPIIMATTGHRSKSLFLNYIDMSRAEMASMLAKY